MPLDPDARPSLLPFAESKAAAAPPTAGGGPPLRGTAIADLVYDAFEFCLDPTSGTNDDASGISSTLAARAAYSQVATFANQQCSLELMALADGIEAIESKPLADASAALLSACDFMLENGHFLQLAPDAARRIITSGCNAAALRDQLLVNARAVMDGSHPLTAKFSACCPSFTIALEKLRGDVPDRAFNIASPISSGEGELLSNGHSPLPTPSPSVADEAATEAEATAAAVAGELGSPPPSPPPSPRPRSPTVNERLEGDLRSFHAPQHMLAGLGNVSLAQALQNLQHPAHLPAASALLTELSDELTAYLREAKAPFGSTGKDWPHFLVFLELPGTTKRLLIHSRKSAAVIVAFIVNNMPLRASDGTECAIMHAAAKHLLDGLIDDRNALARGEIPDSCAVAFDAADTAARRPTPGRIAQVEELRLWRQRAFARTGLGSPVEGRRVPSSSSDDSAIGMSAGAPVEARDNSSFTAVRNRLRNKLNRRKAATAAGTAATSEAPAKAATGEALPASPKKPTAIPEWMHEQSVVLLVTALPREQRAERARLANGCGADGAAYGLLHTNSRYAWELRRVQTRPTREYYRTNERRPGDGVPLDKVSADAMGSVLEGLPGAPMDNKALAEMAARSHRLVLDGNFPRVSSFGVRADGAHSSYGLAPDMPPSRVRTPMVDGSVVFVDADRNPADATKTLKLPPIPDGVSTSDWQLFHKWIYEGAANALHDVRRYDNAAKCAVAKAARAQADRAAFKVHLESVEKQLECANGERECLAHRQAGHEKVLETHVELAARLRRLGRRHVQRAESAMQATIFARWQAAALLSRRVRELSLATTSAHLRSKRLLAMASAFRALRGAPSLDEELFKARVLRDQLDELRGRFVDKERDVAAMTMNMEELLSHRAELQATETALQAEVRSLQAEKESAARQRVKSEKDLTSLKAARASLDRAVGTAKTALREEQDLRVAAEQGAAASARALQAQAAESEAAAREQKAAEQDRDAAYMARDAAVKHAHAADAARDAAIAERDAVIAERDAANAALQVHAYSGGPYDDSDDAAVAMPSPSPSFDPPQSPAESSHAGSEAITTLHDCAAPGGGVINALMLRIAKLEQAREAQQQGFEAQHLAFDSQHPPFHGGYPPMVPAFSAPMPMHGLGGGPHGGPHSPHAALLGGLPPGFVHGHLPSALHASMACAPGPADEFGAPLLHAEYGGDGRGGRGFGRGANRAGHGPRGGFSRMHQGQLHPGGWRPNGQVQVQLPSRAPHVAPQENGSDC